MLDYSLLRNHTEITTSLIQGFTAFIVVAVGAFAIIAIAYLVIDIVKDSKKFHRKQVLKNYRKAEAHIRYKLERSKVTGVLYSKEVR